VAVDGRRWPGGEGRGRRPVGRGAGARLRTSPTAPPLLEDRRPRGASDRKGPTDGISTDCEWFLSRDRHHHYEHKGLKIH